MVTTILTKSSGILGPISNLLGLIMNGIYEFLDLIGIPYIAIAIIIFTFITRALMLPLTIKQQKFTKLSARMNPELQKIQAKYKGKKDEASLRKQQAETQLIYQKYGANPAAGCLPLLITLPIMFALYSVIRNVPAYVGSVKDLYDNIAQNIYHVNGYDKILIDAFHLKAKAGSLGSVNSIIDLLSGFKPQNWNVLAGIKEFSSFSGDIVANSKSIMHINSFLGLNISNSPGLAFPAVLIPIFAMVFQFIQSKQLQVKTNGQENQAASAMKSMNYIMPIMSGIFCIQFPIGIGIYWIAGSVFSIIQQFFVNKYLDKVDVDELIEKNVARSAKRRSSIPNGSSIQELAKKQTKYIENPADKLNDSSSSSNTENTESEEQNNESSGKTSPSSISDIANILKNRNMDKGDK